MNKKIYNNSKPLNISSNFIECSICKNIFLKTHIKGHYFNCKKNEDEKKLKNELRYNTSKSYKNSYQESYQKYTETPKELSIEKYVSPAIVSYNDNMLNHFFNNYDKLFNSYVEGKCIAIVGPAQSILETGKGEIIDKFDLVIRLNKSLPLPSKLKNDIGTKTDIIYNSLNTSDYPGQNNLNTELYKKYGVKFVCSYYPFNHRIFHDDILNYVLKYKFDLPLKVMNDMKFRNFEKMLGTRPYTGTCAIMDLLSYPIKYLYITGLDFYQTKYYSEYRRSTKESLKHAKNSPIHQAKPQLDYLKNISLFDNRIILDNYLDNLLYNDYYKVVKNLSSFDKNLIFNYGDNNFKKYFEMKISLTTFTREYKNSQNIENSPYLIFTDNKNFYKSNNDYCLLVTGDRKILYQLNNNLEIKRFIGNFYFNENRLAPASIYLSSKFLSHLKSSLIRVNINNCNTYLVILLTLMLYLPDKHYFSYNEVLNNWKLTIDEKKLVAFLFKKKILNLI